MASSDMQSLTEEVSNGVKVHVTQQGPYCGRAGVVRKRFDDGRFLVAFDEDSTEAIKVARTAFTTSRAAGTAPLPSPVAQAHTRRTLSEVALGVRAAVVERSRLRVIARDSPFVGAIVRVVAFHDDTACATVVIADGGVTERQVDMSMLEVLPDVNVAAGVAGEVESAFSRAAFTRGDYVRILSGEHAHHKGVFRIRHLRLDERYEVLIEDHGARVVQGAHLARASVQSSARPTRSLPLPPPPKHADGSPAVWSAAQLRAFHVALVERRNLLLTGEPGSGKTEVVSALMKVLQFHNVCFTLKTLSNPIVGFLRQRHMKNGVHSVADVIGTYSSKSWATLGNDYTFGNVPELVDEIVAAPFTKAVRKSMREDEVRFIEEDQNTLPHFKDVNSLVHSGVRGHTGPEPYGNMQMIIVTDERQLGGIKEVTNGLDGPALDAMLPGGESVDTSSFESQILQEYYPKQRVLIAAAHFELTRGGTSFQDVEGVVVRYCSLRVKFLVSCDGAADRGVEGLGSTDVIAVEYVKSIHLSTLGSRAANFVTVHLTSSNRVRAGVYDEALPVAQQSAEGLWHRAISQLHNGITNTPEVRELIARHLDVGARLLTERPDVYELIFFSFMTNHALERYVKTCHIERYRAEDLWRLRPGATIIHSHFAMKCDERGVLLHEDVRSCWDGGTRTDAGGGRQHVAGAVACYLYWKVGYEFVVGTFPNHVFKEGGAAVKIQVGHKKEFGFLKPGDRVVAVGVVPDAFEIAGVKFDGLRVDCPGFGWQGQGYPSAIIPPLLYKSDVIFGSKLCWIQWPLKYRMLTTGHANTGRGYKWFLQTFEKIWCYDAVFSSLTRAMEPPGRIGEDLSLRTGCSGILALNDPDGSFYDEDGMALGLHPKTALRFHELYGKPVPEGRLRSAQAWLDKHKQFHLDAEAHAIEAALAAERAGPSTRADDDAF